MLWNLYLGFFISIFHLWISNCSCTIFFFFTGKATIFHWVAFSVNGAFWVSVLFHCLFPCNLNNCKLYIYLSWKESFIVLLKIVWLLYFFGHLKYILGQSFYTYEKLFGILVKITLSPYIYICRHVYIPIYTYIYTDTHTYIYVYAILSFQSMNLV